MLSGCFNEKKAGFPDRAYAGSLISYVGESEYIKEAPLIQEYLPNKPCTAPDCPVLMPDRQSFYKNQPSFRFRGVGFTSENEIKVLHHSGSRSPGKYCAVFRFRAIPKNRVNARNSSGPALFFKKPARFHCPGDESATGDEGREWCSLDNEGKKRRSATE